MNDSFRRLPRLIPRRSLLALPLLACAGGRAAFASSRGSLRLGLLGQCLVTHDLRQSPWADLAPLTAALGEFDVCFSDLEVVIRGGRAGAPTRDPATVHAAEPEVLDFLRQIGITLLATANNHAFDLGTGGILDTLDALRSRGFAFAGSGLSLAQAAAPVHVDAADSRVALVAAAAGMIRDGGAATESRPGVHEIRGRKSVGLEATDVERMMESIRAARRESGVVIAYLHNHLWEDEVSRTAEWQRDFARRCVDAGASVFVAHGPPLLHGIEMYRHAPLFHGLGSFIFQTRKAESAYGPRNWESLMVDCRFRDGRFESASVRPIALAPVGVDGPADYATRGRPSFARGALAKSTLANVAALSAALGETLRVRGERILLTG